MADKHTCFAELKRYEREGQDYRRVIMDRQSNVAVLAPHGGKIEPGTSEIARAIAGDRHSIYLFEGLKERGNRELHVTSTNFDDPDCLKLIRDCSLVIAIHGKAGKESLIQYGGLDSLARDLIRLNLERAGFTTDHDVNPALAASSKQNICNRGSVGMGVQLELSRGLRDNLMMEAPLLSGFSAVILSALEIVLRGKRGQALIFICGVICGISQMTYTFYSLSSYS